MREETNLTHLLAGRPRKEVRIVRLTSFLESLQA
jgi:hypothetical protein